MPELPEVETIRRILEPQVVGRTITAVRVNNAQVIAHPGAESFVALLQGQRIEGMSRRGKFLTFHLADRTRLCLHLRMTGQLLVTPGDYPSEKHTHLVLELSDGSQIRYIDVRRFGRFWALAPGEEDTVTGRGKLGLEPTDEALNGAYLQERLGRRGVAIKEALLDQSVVAGIGNIYADEILFAARINPQQPCRDLSRRTWNRLAQEIPRIIRWGIETDRMTPEEYLDGAGKEYSDISGLRAYGREGEPCTRCGRPMRRVVIGGRSSCFCPQCQRMRPAAKRGSQKQ